jgi:hypothetical protein
VALTDRIVEGLRSQSAPWFGGIDVKSGARKKWSGAAA